MDSQDNKRKWKNRDFISSLEFAITGIFTAIKEERNMRKHALSALAAILAGLVFRISATEWLFLLLSITLVIAFEIMNSAIENVVDLASNYHFSMLAKNAKDMAAGGVLVTAFGAVVVGICLFGNAAALNAIWTSVTTTPLSTALWVLSLVLAYLFTFRLGKQEQVKTPKENKTEEK